MNAAELSAALCQQYRVQPTSGGLSVITPMRYDDGDHVVVFISRVNGKYQIDDNGEAALRLMYDGIDLDGSRIGAWLQTIKEIHGVAWSDDEEHLVAFASGPEQISDCVSRIAECAAQMQAMTVLRADRSLSDFKDRVIEVLKAIQKETGIEARYDVSVDPDAQLFCDAYFLTDTPLAIVVAPNAQRLLEAELMWLNAKRLHDPLKVLAVVDDPKKVGIQQVMRANYFTDKTVAYNNMDASFRSLVRDALGVGPH